MKRGPWEAVKLESYGWAVVDRGLDVMIAECANADDADMIARNLNETVWGEAYPEVPE